jgi:hypothetical protein
MKKSLLSIHSQISPSEEKAHTIFDRSKQRFFSAVKWNALESFFYHGIFIAHQYALYSFLPAHEYGKIGSLFGFSFLCVTVLLGGLDIALVTAINQASSNKDSFKKMWRHLFVPQFLIIILGGAFFCLFSQTSLLPFFVASNSLLITFFVIGEAVKKLLRHTLQLIFLNRYTAVIEVIGITAYVSFFWTCFIAGAEPSIKLFLLPFIITSAGATCALLFLLHRYYQKLPNTFVKKINFRSFRKIQFHAYINQLCRSLFSSNFLIPALALSTGFFEAGIATLANYMTHTLTFFIHKICMPTAAALFGHTQKLTYQKQKDTLTIAIKLFFTIALLALSILGCYGFINLSSISYTTLGYITLFFLVHVLEHLFTLYEKFFIAHNSIEIFTYANTLTSLCAGYAFYIMHKSNFTYAVLISFSVRLFTIAILSYAIFTSKKLPILSFFKKRHPKNSS